MWEALTTFGFMAILIVLAYGADKCRSRNVNKEE
jgi:hypothetical protein